MSQCSAVFSRRPLPSLPSTNTVGFVNCSACKVVSPPPSRPYTKKPFFFKSSSTRFTFPTSTSGTLKAIPAETFTTVPVTPACRCFGIRTALIPKAAALRITAPTLCGSCTSPKTASAVSCDTSSDCLKSSYERTSFVRSILAIKPWCTAFLSTSLGTLSPEKVFTTFTLLKSSRGTSPRTSSRSETEVTTSGRNVSASSTACRP